MSDIKGMDFNYLMQNQQKINSSLSIQERDNKKIIEYDSKIVSFRIGNQFYGIDIMMVKEILCEKKFTPIPNALDFVRGVFNLRGEIIPIIELSRLFHLDVEYEVPKEGESVIILKVENLLIGVIVEEIMQVFPIQNSNIQPPSSLLGSINEEYISGIIDIEKRLYVILDTEAIFGNKEKAKKEILAQESDLAEEVFMYFSNQVEELGGVHIHSVNKNKFRKLYAAYVKENNVKDMPKLTKDDADKIVKQFYSVNTEGFWNEKQYSSFKNEICPLLKKVASSEIKGIDIGCGNGYESFSLYFILQETFSNVQLVATDSNLGAISNASGLEVDGNEIPNWMGADKNFINVNGNRYKIKKEINDKIYFEFHDAKNLSSDDRKFQIIVARDLSLFMKESEYVQFIKDVAEHLVPNGILIVGDSEVITSDTFIRMEGQDFSVLIKK
ncbi:MAG: chemotaxis protein CheW [Spirochaetales bacterium]|nr:chemotaxis protein CheW [Spirochaetales bacterium]